MSNQDFLTKLLKILEETISGLLGLASEIKEVIKKRERK